MRRYVTEGMGTFILVLVGTGAIVVNQATGVIGHTGIALAFGLVVMAMIYALGEISGAHLNPAVSFGFWLAERFALRDLWRYAAAQALGAILASLTLFLLGPHSTTLGATRFDIPTGRPGCWKHCSVAFSCT